jgi:hypothetical protein
MEEDILTIGGIRIAVRNAFPSLFRLGEVTRRFRMKEISRGGNEGLCPDLVLTTSDAQPIPLPRRARFIHRSPNAWQILRGNGSFFFHAQSALPSAWPEVVTEFSRDWRRCTVSLSYGAEGPAKGVEPLDPLDYPLGHIFIAPLLAQRGGMFLRAGGLLTRGRDGTASRSEGGYWRWRHSSRQRRTRETGSALALLFSTTARSRKSEIMSPLRSSRAFRSLNDEWVVVVKRGSNYFLAGTPWCSENEMVSPEAGKLAAVWFVSGDVAATDGRCGHRAFRLLRNAFVPLWHPTAAVEVLRTCMGIVGTTGFAEITPRNVASSSPVWRNDHVGPESRQ